MKPIHSSPCFSSKSARIRPVCLILAAACLFTLPLRAEEPSEQKPVLTEPQFQEKLRSLERPVNGDERTREAQSLLRERRFSSQQVKAIARTFAQEDARYDFALAAYPRTVDPENFYEVYDAFTSYSRVFRLHDQIQQLRAPATPPGHGGPRPVSETEMGDILKTLRAEHFDDTKKATARQILSGKPRFLSRQVCDLVRLFSFDDAKLEIAKFGYNSVLDPENYFLVNQAFSFNSSKEALSTYVESQKTQRTPRHNP